LPSSAPVIAGCDGSFGPSRAAIPETVRRVWEKTYPYSWLGVLADVAPSTEELIHAWHPDGFAMHSMRSATVSRFYLQVPNGTDVKTCSDQRIWDELSTRLGAGIDAYSEAALQRVWRCTHFSWWMTSMLHISGDPFDATGLVPSWLCDWLQSSWNLGKRWKIGDWRHRPNGPPWRLVGLFRGGSHAYVRVSKADVSAALKATGGWVSDRLGHAFVVRSDVPFRLGDRDRG
jgi:hypothetical protein